MTLLQSQIKAKVAECISLAEAKFGIAMPAVEVKFNLRGRALGMAVCRFQPGGRRTYEVRFNPAHLIEGSKTAEHLLTATVPHEIAHTVCQAYPQLGHRHNAGWQRVCIALGGNGNRLYSADDAPEAVALSRPYLYTLASGRQVRVAARHHTKIQQGAVYLSNAERIDRACQFEYAGPTVEVKLAAKGPAVRTQAAHKGKSKAEQVRELIRANTPRDEVIAFAVAQLGMTKALAAGYYKANSKIVAEKG